MTDLGFTDAELVAFLEELRPGSCDWYVQPHDSSDDTAIILKAADEHGMNA